ncbi:glutamate 5-kinase [Candidatus Kaiserbacteria bacterium]|nr:glutamate 5-kinase [Candidatus Kaiserbacteria bacterium]
MLKRIVIKVGSGVITDNGNLDEGAVRAIVKEVAELLGKGTEVVLVTSGAVATGKGVLGVTSPSGSMAERQVFAAVGQVGLMSLYAKLFQEHGYRFAQILLTKGDFRDKEHYANIKEGFENLLKAGIVPVVNENDAIAIHKQGFSDNDELAGLIAGQLNPDAVLFLSTIDGVLMKGADGKETVVREIRTDDIAEYARFITKTKSSSGRGGMETKFRIAKKLMDQGIATYIINGKKEGVIATAAEGRAVGTKFIPEGKLSAVKRRLAYSEGFSTGSVYVNAGAEEILMSKKSVSLLPVGVTKIEGAFKKGDVIDIRNESGEKLGIGIAQYDAAKAEEGKGKKGGRALVHYDSMLIGQ